jgi:hypothetical protein
MSCAPDTLQPADTWRKQPACAAPQYADHRDLWFAEDSEREALRAAVKVCRGCPIRALCLATATIEEEGKGRQNRWGIRGGLTARQRWDADPQVTDREPQPSGKPLAPCGTPAAYDRHIRKKEPIDQPCRDAHARQKREREALKRAAAAECGTRGGYHRHRRNGETACDACRKANADADRRLRNTGTTKATASQNGQR